MVAHIPFFPTPYPGETLYSIFCRYWQKSGRPSFRVLSEELFSRRIALNTYMPQGIGIFTQKLPLETGLTPDFFIKNMTAFPYFAPFLSSTKTAAYLEYLNRPHPSEKSDFFALGIGKLRQPKNLHLRFCDGCREDDINRFGEAYWHRAHQMAGVLMCHKHKRPLMDSKILVADANRNFYPADENAYNGTPCGFFYDNVAEKLILLAADTAWILENGDYFGNNENTYEKYDPWLRTAGLRSLNGRTWHKKIFQAVNEGYGKEFLDLIGAYDDNDTTTWTKRILFYRDKLVHPMFHLLLIRMIAGSAEEFFISECEKPLPYGKGPWPCRNPVCPHNRQDVIESISIRRRKSLYRALFECPHCGFSYRRKNPIPKERQYDEHIYVAGYGHLWESKLRECLVDRRLSTRRTCEFLQCDLYTVHKYAVQLGLLNTEEVTFLQERAKLPPPEQPVAALTGDEKKAMYREKWVQLTLSNPGATRSLLKSLAPKCCLWLRKNDLEWYEQNSPELTYLSMDWDARDNEILSQVQAAVTLIHNTGGKPRWINRNTVTSFTGLNQLHNKNAMRRLPRTSAYLEETLESIVDWRKRKIVWAIDKLRSDGVSFTPYKVSIVAAVSKEAFQELYDFSMEYLESGCSADPTNY